MIRMIFFVAFVVIVFLAVTTIWAGVRALAAPDGPQAKGAHDGTMPASFRRITFILLLILMLGVASGWVGGL